MKEVTAYLNFDGKCREAMTFYHKALGGEVIFAPFTDEKGQPLADPSARIMHSSITVGGRAVLMASDTPDGDAPKGGSNISVAIQCESVEEIDRQFAGLSQGGTIEMELQNVPWGARFGIFTDRYGFRWLLNCQL